MSLDGGFSLGEKAVLRISRSVNFFFSLVIKGRFERLFDEMAGGSHGRAVVLMIGF